MSFRVDYDNVNNCIVGRFEGEFTSKAFDDYLQEISRVAKQYDCLRFLNDLRGAVINISVFDLSESPARTIDSTFDRRWKRAIVLNPDSLSTEKREFFETVNENRGVSVKTFNDMAEALDWLKTKQSS